MISSATAASLPERACCTPLLRVSTWVVVPRYSLCMVPRPPLLGVLFGFLLALRAVRMDPIHARRHRRVSSR
jgi:hypothetical protein